MDQNWHLKQFFQIKLQKAHDKSSLGAKVTRFGKTKWILRALDIAFKMKNQQKKTKKRQKRLGNLS